MIQIQARKLYLFLLFWVFVFVLYFPTSHAGLTGEFPFWEDIVQNRNFWDYLNRKDAYFQSTYQLTQLLLLLLNKVCGLSQLRWHLVMISLQAVNSFLLYLLCTNIFKDSGVKQAHIISAAGVLLFCVSPYLSEAVVYQPSFHFLLSFTFILLVLYSTQQYIYNGKRKHIWWASIIFFLSTYCLEVFYITPLLVILLIGYYRIGLNIEKIKYKKLVLFFILPLLIIFGHHFVVFYLIYHSWVMHGVSGFSFTITNLSKPLKYIFHLLFFGRFFPRDEKLKVYSFLEHKSIIIMFYTIVLLLLGMIAIRFRKMNGKGKAFSLLFIWTLIPFIILMQIWFQDEFYILYDRYSYSYNAFGYITLAMGISYLSIAFIRYALLAAFFSVNVYFTLLLEKYWYQSAHIVHNMLYQLPETGNKIVLMLNLPGKMNGVPLLDGGAEGVYKQTYNFTTHRKKLENQVLDVASYNIITNNDGAHVKVENDSMVTVTLNQWGTWWWYNRFGAISYENEYCKVDMKDPGHWYQLTLKKNPKDYMLFYQVGDQLKIVDMNKKNENQN